MRGKVRYAEAINSKVALRVDIFGFYNTRLYQQFLLWEKWHVNSITFQFVPTLSKTAPGTIAMAPDYDPEDVHRPEMANIMDSMNSKASAICETFQVVMPNFKQPDGVTVIPSLFTDWRGPPRTTTYGLLKYVVSGTGLAANASVGYIDLVYDITFLIPQKEPDDQIYPDTTTTFTLAGANTTWYNMTNGTVDTTAGNGHWLVPDVACQGNKIYSGVLGAGTGLAALLSHGFVLSPGTRIFWRGPQNLYTDGVGMTQQNTAAIVGPIATGPSFRGNELVSWTGNVADTLSITGAISWYA
jgi:hypothetical protein